MMKLFERFTVHETHPEVEEHLPELPEGVTVPDDLSGLEVPTRRVTAVRWMRWVPVGIVLAAGGLALALILPSDGPTGEVAVEQSSVELVQESIDEALAEARAGRSSVELVQESIDAALAEARAGTVVEQRSSVELVQESIDAALAEARAGTVVEQRSSVELVQESIDAALAEARAGERSSVELVQESIDAALAEARGDDTP